MIHRRAMLGSVAAILSLFSVGVDAAPVRLRRSAPAAPAPTLLGPSLQWDGTPASGYGDANPAKPQAGTRDAARPALRPLFLQHHLITGDDGSHLLVWTSRSKSGVSRIQVGMEGNFIDISTRSWVSYTDERGVGRKLFGYVAPVDYAAAQAIAPNGIAVVTCKSWARNGSYLPQVCPERIVHFRPGAALTAGARYSVVKTVGPTGADYTTLAAAMAYAAANNASQYVGIKILASGNYKPQSGTTLLAAARPVEVFAATGVTAVMGDYSSSIVTPSVDGLRFRGMGIVIDTSTSTTLGWALHVRTTSNGVLQFDGVEIKTGDGGPSAAANGITGSGATILRNGKQPSTFWIGNAATYGHIEFKDCDVHDMAAYGLVQCDSIINCDLRDISGTAVENLKGVMHGGSITRIGGVLTGLVDHVNALDLTFAGPGVGSYSHTGVSNGTAGASNGVDGYFNLYVDGVFVQSFNLATYGLGPALAGAINAYGTGWTATADPANDRAMAHLSRAGQVPSYILYPPIALVAGAASLTTIMDIHADAIVHHSATYSNVLAEFVEIDELVAAAPISVDASATMEDAFWSNINVRDTSAAEGKTAQAGYLKGVGRHVGWSNITIQGTGAGEFFGNGPMAMDTDCFLTNVYAYNWFWSAAVDADLAWQGLAINNATLPTGATAGNYSTSLGGAAESTYLDAATGVPVLGGLLLAANGDYRGAKVPTALADADNQGWAIAA